MADKTTVADQRAIDKFIAEHGVSRCEVRWAAGALLDAEDAIDAEFSPVIEIFSYDPKERNNFISCRNARDERRAADSCGLKKAILRAAGRREKHLPGGNGLRKQTIFW